MILNASICAIISGLNLAIYYRSDSLFALWMSGVCFGVAMCCALLYTHPRRQR